MMFSYSLTVEKSVEELILDLEEKLKEVNFGILCKIELHKKLREKGFSSEKEYTVLEVCNPKEASEILSIDSMISCFLPCKILITHDSKITNLSLVLPTALISLMDNERLSEQLISKANEVETNLISTIKKVAKN